MDNHESGEGWRMRARTVWVLTFAPPWTRFMFAVGAAFWAITGLLIFMNPATWVLLVTFAAMYTVVRLSLPRQDEIDAVCQEHENE